MTVEKYGLYRHNESGRCVRVTSVTGDGTNLYRRVSFYYTDADSSGVAWATSEEYFEQHWTLVEE